MKLEWDDEKRRKNISKHGVDLIYAALIFEGPTLTKIDNRRTYGEELHFAGLGGRDGIRRCSYPPRGAYPANLRSERRSEGLWQISKDLPLMN